MNPKIRKRLELVNTHFLCGFNAVYVFKNEYFIHKHIDAYRLTFFRKKERVCYDVTENYLLMTPIELIETMFLNMKKGKTLIPRVKLREDERIN